MPEPATLHVKVEPITVKPESEAPAAIPAPLLASGDGAAYPGGVALALTPAATIAAAGPDSPSPALAALVANVAAVSGNAAAGRVVASQAGPISPASRVALPQAASTGTATASGARARPGTAAPAAGPDHQAAEGEAAGASDLDAWKAAVSSATAAIAPPALEDVTTSADKLAAGADATRQARAAQRPDPLRSARERLAPEPNTEFPDKQLDTSEADRALASVNDAGAKLKLVDQTFPAMTPMPSELAPLTRPPAPIAGAPDAPAAAPATIEPATADPKAQAIPGKLAAVAPARSEQVPAAPVVVSDPGAAVLAPLPPTQATHIGDVVARLLAGAPVFARQIVDAASQTLDPRKEVGELTAIAGRLLPAEQDALTGELQGIATAAGLSADALQAKIATQVAATGQQAAAAGARLDARAESAKNDVEQRGDQDLRETSGAAAAVRDEVDRKQAAVKGAADPVVVNGRRDTYLQNVADGVASGEARLHSAIDRRTSELQRIASEQKMEYARQTQTVAEQLEAAAADPTAGRIAARPVRDWDEQRAQEVDGHLARLTREAREDQERLEEQLKSAASAARDQVRDWAAARLGYERSWWDRLWDLFTDWAHQAKVDNKAWEAQRSADTRDQVAADFTMLAKLHDDLVAGNRDAVITGLSQLTDAQRDVFAEFFRSGGRDTVGAVAAGLAARLRNRRAPELAKQLEDTAIAELGWEALNRLGAIQTPGFDAGVLVREVRGSVKGWGTDEKRLFKALTGRTPIQVAAMRKAYAAVYEGRNMDEDIDDDLSGSELERANALRTGDPVAGAVATLHDAMEGLGTDEELIFRTLRGKTPAERDAIIAAYKERYGVTLQSDLDDELSGNELGQATALLQGDHAKADAMAVAEAMSGPGTDEDAINAVYQQIRDEVESDAVAKGMNTEEVRAEIQRRTEAVRRSYGVEFAGGDSAALEAAYRDELSGGELDIVLAAEAADQTAVDAAKIQIEHESLWTSDDKVNEVLKAQHSRAEREALRDLTVEFNRHAQAMTPQARRAGRERLREQATVQADARAKENMRALKETYDRNNHEDGAFDAVIDWEVSGYSQDEARERIGSGGKLSDAKEMKYAIFGLGTNEEVIRSTLRGKSKSELEQLAAEYKQETGNDLAEDLHGDLSGRDEADMTSILETGDSTRAEKLAYLQRRRQWELTEGTGYFGGGLVDEETAVLERTSETAQKAADEYEQARKQFGDDDPRTVATGERLDRWLGYGEKDIERRREELDAITDTLATVGAVVIGVAVTVLTAGAAAPAVAAAAAALGTTTTVVAAVAGAVAATAASITIKEDLKGGAYGGEDMAVDFVQGIAETIVAATTAGTGEATFKLLARSPAFAALARAGESGLLAQLAVKATESGIEGAIQGLPSGMIGAILNESTWKSSDPFAVIMRAGGQASLQGGVMGGAMGAGFEGVMRHRAPAAVHGGEPGGAARTPAAAEHAPPVRAADGALSDTQSSARAAPAQPDAVVPDHISSQSESPIPVRAPEEVGHPARRVSPGGPEDEPTGKLERPAEEETTTGRTTDEPTLIDLREGSIMHGPKLSAADAETMYAGTIADTPHREAAIYENVDTGERIVVQGTESITKVAPKVWAEFAPEHPDSRYWRGIKHYHPIEEGGVTPQENRYPSGRGGDLDSIAADAQFAGGPQAQSIDIVTESGPEKINFGYDPTDERPYWVDLPGPEGSRVQARLESLEAYHEWYKQQTGFELATVDDEPTAGQGQVGHTPEGLAAPGPKRGGPSEPPRTAEAPSRPSREPSLRSKPADVQQRRIDELNELLPNVPINRNSPLRVHAADLLAEITPEHNELLLKILESNPAKAGDRLTMLGRFETAEDLDAALDAHFRRPEEPFAGSRQMQEHLDEVAPLVVDQEGVQIKQMIRPERVDPGEILTARSNLRANMTPPEWASKPGDWNAHHLIPFEFAHDPIFDVLRANGGWDHNDPFDGIALPTRLGIKGAEGLPVHQVTAEVVNGTGSPASERQTLIDLRGHGVLNEHVGERLAALRQYLDDPVKLREEVNKLVADLRHDVETSVARGLPVQF